MGDKEGGDPEKKMTKDFLDRWKKIATKYEPKEGEQPPPERPEKAPGGPKRTAEEELDALLEGLGQKPAAPHGKEKEVEDLLADFGLGGRGEKPEGPKKGPPAAEEQTGQRRVMDTLKKVGLVGSEPPAAGKDEDEDEEESLLLELESLLGDEEANAPKGDEPGATGGAFEEEDLIAELEVMLEGDEAAEPRAVEGEPARPAKAAPEVAPAPQRAPRPEPEAPKKEEPPVEIKPKTPAPPPVMPAPAPEPPRATPARGARPSAERAGRVNGGRVNGGRVNGGRVNGGRVNGGRVNGGRVNGGRVNGGRAGGARGVLPATAAQARRARVTQIAVAGAVTVGLFMSLVLLVPTGTGPSGPQVDGNLDDWAGSGALFYTGDADAGYEPSLDLREYAIRQVDGSNLWFTARTASDFFVRGGGSPARGDVLLVLIDEDGSAATGYSYRDIGADRVVEVTGWSGAMRGASSRAFTNRPAYDWSGFETAGAVQVVVSGDRVEGVVTGLSGLGDRTRAAFVLRGVAPGGVETTDAPHTAATIGQPGISVVAQPVATGLLDPGATSPSAMLRLSIQNPSPQEVQVTGLRATARYAPQVPASLITGSVWQDNNGNGAIETSVDVRISGQDITLSPTSAASMTFANGPTIAPGGRVNLIVAVDTVPAGVAEGTSLVLSVAGPAGVTTSGSPHIGLSSVAPPAGFHPGSYVGAPPTSIAVDGIPTDWDRISGAADAVGDVSSPSVDITGAKGNASAGTVSFLVSFDGEPLAGALVPTKLPATQQLPGGGGGGLPGLNPPNPGSDFLFVMFDSDNNASTGFRSGGHGYDYGIRVDAKAGQIIGAAGEILRWDLLPNPGWVALPADPAVAFGSRSVELAAAIPTADLTARNVTATAYATSWDGARDNLDDLLVFGNELGSRGAAERTIDIPVGEQTLWPPGAEIPEFQEVAVPIAGAALVFFVARRRPHRREAKPAT